MEIDYKGLVLIGTILTFCTQVKQDSTSSCIHGMYGFKTESVVGVSEFSNDCDV